MTTTLVSEFKSQKGLLTRRYDWQYNASLQIVQGQLINLVSEIINGQVDIFKVDSLIKNIKGRDQQNIISKQTEIPFDHELLFIQLGWKPEVFGLDREGDRQEKSCNFHLISPFDHFQGNDIFHKVTKIISGEAPPELSLNLISTTQGINLEKFRLGLDFFGQSSFANWFISAPVVLESLIIEASAREIKLRLQSDGHKSKNETAYDEQGTISIIFKTIANQLGIDLASDLKSKLPS